MEGSTNNVAGHRAKYDLLSASLPKDEVGPEFVGGGDAALTGFNELELLRNLRSLEGSRVLDIGCGIGRLTKYLMEENISQYLGLDIVPEILAEAIEAAKNNTNFRFDIARECKLPAPDAEFDIVCGFSLITHLLDEETFEYFTEARRVLRPGGFAVFSFIDFENETHRKMFFAHARQHRLGHGDLLKFTTKSVLKLFAAEANFLATTFIDSGIAEAGPLARSTLLDGRRAPKTINIGQSVCIMTA